MWWPLAASWLMMGLEQPLVGAVVARLPNPEVQLAAYGGVVFPIALVVEAPVIMLLAASTELSRDGAAYRSLARVTHGLGLGLTLLHLLVAVTPLFDVIVGTLLDVPPAVREPARLGLLLLLPWTWAIASRRFHQGLLIRRGHSRAVGVGTGVRLCVTVSVLSTGLAVGTLPGVVVASSALSLGVIAEASYAAWRSRPVVRSLPERSERAPLRGRGFWRFYVPLAMTPLITLVILPVGSAAVSRMPQALWSLAVWPMVNALAFVLQALGLAFNEVVVALLDEPGARPVLRRFSRWLALAVTVLLGLLSLTPLADLWFSVVAGLSPPLSSLAAGALWLALPIPAMRVLQSWYQGLLLNARRTRAITEAVVVFAVVCCGLLVYGVWRSQWPGLHVVVVGYSAGRVLQTAWLAVRARGL
ncbi:MAG: hypothetical protein AB1Z98_28485 [Nannocystaceae bacterium]